MVWSAENKIKLVKTVYLYVNCPLYLIWFVLKQKNNKSEVRYVSKATSDLWTKWPGYKLKRKMYKWKSNKSRVKIDKIYKWKWSAVCLVSTEIVFYNLNCAQKELQ